MGETLPSHCLLFINHHSRRCSTEDNKQFLSISSVCSLFHDSNRQKVNVEVTFPTGLKVIFRFKVRTCPRSVKDISMRCF